MFYQGTIRFVHELEGTKSEGDYAYLVVDEKSRYRLYRAGSPAADSEFLRPFENQEVIVEGVAEDEETMCITTINNEEV